MVLSVICGKLLRDAIQPLCLPDSHEQATNQNVFYELLHSIKGHLQSLYQCLECFRFQFLMLVPHINYIKNCIGLMRKL